MEHQVFKEKMVGLMVKIELGASYMQDVNRRVKRMNDALKTEPKGDRQLRLPFGGGKR